MSGLARVVIAAAAVGSMALAGCTSGTGTSSDLPRVTSYRTGDPSPRAPAQQDADPSEAAVRRAGLARCPSTPPDAEPVAGGLPDITLPCLGRGPDVRLPGLRGRPTVLNVWAQWCAPCREEAPAFQALYERAAGRVQVLGVDFEDAPTPALQLAAELRLRYPSVMDQEGRLKAPLRLVGLPRTVFVDADGRVAYVLPAPVRDAEQLAELVSEHLGVAL